MTKTTRTILTVMHHCLCFTFAALTALHSSKTPTKLLSPGRRDFFEWRRPGANLQMQNFRRKRLRSTLACSGNTTGREKIYFALQIARHTGGKTAA